MFFLFLVWLQFSAELGQGKYENYIEKLKGELVAGIPKTIHTPTEAKVLENLDVSIFYKITVNIDDVRIFYMYLTELVRVKMIQVKFSTFSISDWKRFYSLLLVIFCKALRKWYYFYHAHNYALCIQFSLPLPTAIAWQICFWLELFFCIFIEIAFKR